MFVFMDCLFLHLAHCGSLGTVNETHLIVHRQADRRPGPTATGRLEALTTKHQSISKTVYTEHYLNFTTPLSNL